MTKKDYQLIANAILEARRGLAAAAANPRIVKPWADEQNASVGDIFEHAVYWAVRELTLALQQDNPRFNPERFEDACLKKLNG